MADEEFPDGELNDEDSVAADQPVGDQHSAFLPDEELHEQLPDEGDGDERTALSAAHQGARGTALPLDSSGAYNLVADADLLDETADRVGAQTSSANQPFDAALAGNPAVNVLQDGLGSELPASGGDPAQNAADGGGRGAGTAAQRGPGASEFAGANADDALQFDDGDTGQGSSGALASDGTTNEDFSLDAELSAELGPRSAGNGDGLGGSGDQSSGVSAGSGDDGQEEYSEDDDGQGTGNTGDGGGGKGGGVNPIIGDRFDNVLAGTDGRDMINAMDGDDTVSGGAGDDLIMGKKGDDWLEGGLGDDTLVGGHGDDTFIFTDADFDGNGWTDVIDGQGQNGKAGSDYDTIDLSGVSQGWTLEVDGAGAGAEATNLSGPAQYAESGGEFSGTITFDDGSTIAFDNIEKIDW